MKKEQQAAPPARAVETESVSADLPPELEAIAARGTAREEPRDIAPLGEGLMLGRIISIDENGISLRIGDHFADAKIDPSLEVTVLRTASERGEPVLVERRAGVVTVVAALRMQATPGIDKMREINFEADKITMTAKNEVVVRSGLAAMAVRAVGEIETYAERIVSRAEGVHKIIGRMLRLN